MSVYILKAFMYNSYEPKRKEVSQMRKGKQTNLERLRREAGLTMMELSEISGVSYPTIVKIEADRIGEVTVKTILRLSDALKCNPAELF